MLDVGHPGELPLIKELTALKKSKGLRDPSPTSGTSSQKSQVAEALANFSNLTDTFDTFAQDNLPAEDMGTRKEFQYGAGGSSMKPKNATRTHGAMASSSSSSSSKKEFMVRSPQMENADSQRSWDIGKETFISIDVDTAAGADDFRRHRDDVKNQLEKLGILGSSSNGKHGSSGGKSLLRNWTHASVSDNDDGGGDMNNDDDDADLMDAKRFEQEETSCQEMQDWLDANRGRMSTGQQGFSTGYRNESVNAGRDSFSRRSRASQGIPRMPKHDRIMSRENAQMLSPLALSSHDDHRKFSHSKSFFSLEEPYDEEQYSEEDGAGNNHNYAVQGMRYPAAFISSTPQAAASRRPSRYQAVGASNMNSQYAHMFHGVHQPQVSRSSLMQPQMWETDFSGYSAKQKSKNNMQRPPKYHRAAAPAPGMQESNVHKLPSDLQKLTERRANGASSHTKEQTMRPHRQSSMNSYSSYPERDSDADPLPLLTELEDYSGSEATSADEGPSESRKIHSESELDQIGFGAKNTDGAGHKAARRIVKVPKKENQLQLAVPECKELALCDYKPRNLSQKYRPKAFEEVVGQNIVTQALSNAVLKGKIAPVYLFQGSRGTGKTTAARIFAAALICTSSDGRRPCGACRECISVATGKCSEVKEVDAASNNGIERVKSLLEETISAPPLSRYKVFIIDECHVLTTETWNALLKILEEPPMNVVFILITTDPDRLPRTAVSRCQKFPFPKIKESEIVKRLQDLAGLENLVVDSDTLQLIASRSDGSLRDAEITLDQLSLLGQQINASTVYELVGSASDDRMLNLLDSALRADTVNTVRKARELVDSGVEPLSLMSRLATLITDILAGSFKFTDKQQRGFFRKQTLSDEKLEWLRMAMKTLSEAEKQLRNSNDRATWLTAALLQLGPDRSSTFLASGTGTSVTQSPVALDDIGENEAADFEYTSSGRQTWDDEQNPCQNTSSDFMANNDVTTVKIQRQGAQFRCLQTQTTQAMEKQKHGEGTSDDTLDATNSRQLLSSSARLDDIWNRVVERCWPLPLRQSLHAHGKLVSISMSGAGAVIRLEVSHPDQKSRCERSQKSIANVFESVLGCPADVQIILGSLPPEEELGDQNWMSRDQYHSSQEAFHGGSDELLQGTISARPYSLSYGTTMGSHQSSSTIESFPAIPLGSFGSPLTSENQLLDQTNNSFCWNDNNHILEASRDAGRNPHSQSMSDGVNVYVHRVESHDGDGYSDDDKEVDVLETQAFESHETNAFREKIRPRHSSMDGPFNGTADGRRSCDTQKKKGSGLKMVRGLTMRNRICSNPNSPDRRGSSRKNKDSVISGDGSEIGDATAEPTYAVHKKNKLKEAAGSVARFFKGGK